MVKEFYEQYMHIYGLAILCGVGIFLKVMVSLLYSMLIRASDKMGASKNKLMKLIRLKFETCYKLRIGVHNVETFVDKYIYKYRFLGILLSTWENFSGQILILCMFCGTVGVIAALIYNAGRFAVWSTLFSAVMASIFLVTMDSILNLEGKKKHLRINIVDYLDNYLKIRLQQEYMPDLFPRTVSANEMQKVISHFPKERDKTYQSIREEDRKDPGMEELVKSLLQDETEIAAVEEQNSTAVKSEMATEKQRNSPIEKDKSTAFMKEKKTEKNTLDTATENRIIAEVLQEYMA